MKERRKEGKASRGRKERRKEGRKEGSDGEHGNEIIVSSRIPMKLFLEFCPEIFCTFLGASWKVFWLLGDLLNNIIIQEAYRKPQKLPKSP